MIKKNKKSGRKMVAPAGAAGNSDRQSYQQLRSERNQVSEVADKQQRAVSERQMDEENNRSRYDRKKMQMEQIGMTDPKELSLTQAVKKRRDAKRR